MSSETGMSVHEVASELGLTPLTEVGGSKAVSGAIVSDLLSYVMANGEAGQVWVTLQGHANVVAVAALAGLSAIVIAAGFQPEDETRYRAEEEGLALFVSSETPFALAGKLYLMGVR